jgi:hypothetical protein
MNRLEARAWLRRAAAWTPLVLAGWAFAHAVSFTHEFGLNVPCSDGWPYVALHEMYNAHTLSFGDLFAMHNEHLFFVPRVLFVAIGAATHVNLMAQQYLSHVELLLTLLFIWLVAARQFGRRWFQMPWWFAAVPFLVFNLAQWRNLICSFQSGFITSVPLSLGAYYFLSRHCRAAGESARADWRAVGWFALAVASGLLASFSTATGLAVWPAGGLLLLIGRSQPLGRVGRWFALSWALAALIAGSIFARYYRASNDHSHEVGKVVADFWTVASKLVRFCLSLLGSPLESTLDASLFGGALLLLVAVVCLVGLVRARTLRENAFNIACVVQVLATLAMIAVGRIHLGENYSQQSRYVTLIVPLWVAVVCMAASLMEHYRSAQASGASARSTGLLSVALCLSALAVGTAWLGGPEVGAQKRADLIKQVRKLRKGHGAERIYVKRWQALGVTLDQ